MGPFFGVGELVGLPGWVVQRLWWALLLCVAFVGLVRVCRALGLGTPGSAVLAGFAYALSPHVLSLVGPTSVEAWPTAVAPWVLLPLVRGAESGSPRRAAALSALAVAMCGGVNAVATSAVLPVGMVWLLTRGRGPRRRSLLVWWPAADGARDTVVVGAAAAARPLQRAVPRLHRERPDHHQHDQPARHPGRYVGLGRLRLARRLGRRAPPRHDALPAGRRRRRGRPGRLAGSCGATTRTRASCCCRCWPGSPWWASGGPARCTAGWPATGRRCSTARSRRCATCTSSTSCCGCP